MSQDRHASEAARIRKVFDLRKARIPPIRYSVWERDNLYRTQQVERELLRLLEAHGFGFQRFAEARILDVGCGAGFWLRRFIQWGASPERLAGVDLIQERVDEARSRTAAAVRLGCADAAKLPFDAAGFDIVMQATVFSSILAAETRQAVAAEMLRVLAPGGIIVWNDCFWANPLNPDLRPVSRGEILSLFPGCRLDLRRVTLAPPLARLASWSWLLSAQLESIPLLCTNYLGVLRKD